MVGKAGDVGLHLTSKCRGSLRSREGSRKEEEGGRKKKKRFDVSMSIAYGLSPGRRRKGEEMCDDGGGGGGDQVGRRVGLMRK